MKASYNQHNIPVPKKSLGQNFLIDPNVLKRIVSYLPNASTELAIEVGTGTGNLTNILCNKFSKVVTIEKDDRLISWLKENDKLPQNCRLIHNDILDVSFSSIVKEEKVSEAVVVGNLPYNISSQIVFNICNEYKVVPIACFLFQKEVAERITSPIAKKSYGVLSLVAQLFYKVKIVMELPPHLFKPQPKVVSSLVLFERKEEEPFVQDFNVFLKVVKAAFAQRRKKIINSMHSNLKLDKTLLEEALKKADIDPSQRAEKIDIKRFEVLSEALRGHF